MTSATASTPPASLSTHLKTLFAHSAIYGSQDAAAQVINLALTPLYVWILTPTEVGLIVILFTFSTVAKVVFRLGLDSGFFRIYYDLESDEERARLVGTIALFAAAVSTTLFLLVVVGAPLLLKLLGLEGAHARVPLLLAAADIYAGTFAFIPLNLLRIQGRARTFAAVNVGRNLLNTVLKLTFVLTGFGVQALTLADRLILVRFQPLAVVGIYDKAYALGAGVKFGLSPFETAWQPFVLSRLRLPEAPRILAGVITYAAAAFVTLALGIALFGRELLMALTFTRPVFWTGAPVIPVVVLAYLLHGAFLLLSIGIGIEKRARYYPMITAAAAGTNIALDLVLIPGFGMMGAAWATVAGYFVMAALGGIISHRLYPIPLETGRLGQIVLAAATTYALSRLAPDGLVAAVAVKAALLGAFALTLIARGILRGPGGGIVEQTAITGEQP